MEMKRLLLVLTLSIVLLETFAQQKQKRFTPERFQAELEQYITQKAGLLPKEAAKFFPVYREMREEQRVLFDELKSLKRVKPVSDAECRKNIMKRDECEIEIKEIQKEYHEKFMKVLPAKKVYDVLKYEDRFHRQVFRRAAKKHRKKN